MKRMIIFFAVALLAAFTTTAAALQRQQVKFSEKLIRLHVVANSDSKEDQELKIKVRDAVLEIIQGVENKEQMQAITDEVQIAAAHCLLENGSNKSVAVTLEKEHFPTRVYNNFALPAGTYTALRVTIGDGTGKNWWCVAFPSICFRATAADLEEAAVSAGFTQNEVSLITEANEGYVLKFKIIEWMGEVKNHIYENKKP